MTSKTEISSDTTITKNQVLERLKTIKYPGFSRDIVSFGLIKDVFVQGASVKVIMNITSGDKKIRDQIPELVREQLETMPDVENVAIETLANQEQQQSYPSGHPSGHPIGHAPGIKSGEKLLKDVNYKIAVSSGKGGVGKSTVAVNLALALAVKGARVGLLDGDIHGPNIPIMTGISEKPKGKDNKILPISKFGIKIMSIGFFLEKKMPVIWRGPMVGKAIEQLIRDVVWEDLDFFIIDMPPGTGDAQLSLSSLIDLTGSIVVSTPQDVALADVIKGVKMFQKVDVEILGLIENMSYFICPHCEKRTEIFAHGNTKKVCLDLDVPFIGEIPLDAEIRRGGDSGKPIVVAKPESSQALAFGEIAENILIKMPLKS